MTISRKVIWSEGMFLHPHHFQQQDRHVENLVKEQTQTTQPYYWGITELKVDEQLLLLGKIAVISCRGVLPDGTFFNVPTHDKAPPPLTVPPGTTHSMIYLALPSKRAGNPEVSLEMTSGQTSRYQAETIAISDNNFGSEIVTPIQIGQLNLRLLLSKDDNQGFECLGICRISEIRSDGKVVLDEQYIPPCLNVHAVPALVSFMQEAQGLIHYRGNVLMQRIMEHETTGTSEVSDFLILQIMNRFEPLIAHLNTIKSLHPEQLYSTLIQIAGELSTFTSSQRRPAKMPQYLHHDLHSTFMPVMNELRRGLSIVIEETAIALKLEEKQPNTWVSTLHDKTLFDKCTFILSVCAEMPQDELRKLFPAQTKSASVEELRQLVMRALPGIDLTPLSTAPRQIPYHANHLYFTYNEQHPLWQQLKNSAALAIHVGGNFPGLILKLWAIRDKT